MPTGYTAPIEEDPNFTFRDFALRTAFAFLIEGRDGFPLKRTAEPSNYYQNRIWQIKAMISELEEMTPEDIEEACALDFRTELESVRDMNKVIRQKLSRYEAMRKQAEDWDAPEELQNLKEYLLNQIDDSTRYLGVKELPKKQMPGDWHAEQLKWARRDLEVAEANLGKARENIARRNKWVAVLFDEFEVEGEVLPQPNSKTPYWRK